MPRPGYIRQPGSDVLPRVVAAAARGRGFDFEIAAGTPLLEGARLGFARAGFTSGVLEFGEMALEPFAYVMPDLAKDATHVAYYSAVTRPRGVVRTGGGAMTFGLKSGAPFYHCHAVWTEADGLASGGHLLPEACVLAEPCTVTALGLDGAGFAWGEDREINFTVPGPVKVASTGVEAPLNVHALRLRPNQDLCGVLEAYCSAKGIARAQIRGGVGSTIGALFADGREVTEFVTEVYIAGGRIGPGLDGAPRAEIEVGLVDLAGKVSHGVLARGENPVLMTFELVLSEL